VSGLSRVREGGKTEAERDEELVSVLCDTSENEFQVPANAIAADQKFTPTARTTVGSVQPKLKTWVVNSIFL